MNTRELLQQAIANLKEENNTEAYNNIETAKKADVDNTFEALADKLYSDLLIEDEAVATKFKNLYSKFIDSIEEEEGTNSDTVVVNNNTTNKSGSSLVTWLFMIIIVLVIIYFGSQLFSVTV